jgi:hypothetical protein
MSKDMFQDKLWDVTWNWHHYIIWANGPSYNTSNKFHQMTHKVKYCKSLLQGMDMLLGIKII